MPILTAPAATGSTATWSDNEDVVAGSVDTDDVTSGTSQSTSVRTGSGTDAQSGTVVVASGSTSSVTGARATGVVSVTTGTSTATGNNGGATGSASLSSGATSVTTAHTGGNSGAVNVLSGATSCSDAGGTGGNSGAVNVASGSCASTAGTSGNSGNVTITTGNSDEGTSGNLSLSTGTTAAAGATGNITLRPGVGTGGGARGAVVALGLRTESTSSSTISGARLLQLADSGGVFTVSQAAAYDIDLPNHTVGAGLSFRFYLGTPGANNVTITVNGGAATFIGTIVNDVTSVIPATGSTLTFVTGTAALGDNIEIFSLSNTLYGVRAVTSAAGGITIT